MSVKYVADTDLGGHQLEASLCHPVHDRDTDSLLST